jgi:hypothetical protein
MDMSYRTAGLRMGGVAGSARINGDAPIFVLTGVLSGRVVRRSIGAPFVCSCLHLIDNPVPALRAGLITDVIKLTAEITPRAVPVHTIPAPLLMLPGDMVSA